MEEGKSTLIKQELDKGNLADVFKMIAEYAIIRFDLSSSNAEKIMWATMGQVCSQMIQMLQKVGK